MSTHSETQTDGPAERDPIPKTTLFYCYSFSPTFNTQDIREMGLKPLLPPRLEEEHDQRITPLCREHAPVKHFIKYTQENYHTLFRKNSRILLLI